MRAINSGLKDICLNLEIDFKVTTNWARHSWASLARNKAGVPKADIDFCLGHVNNDYKMADIYIDIDYSICDKANRAVLDLLQEKEEKKAVVQSDSGDRNCSLSDIRFPVGENVGSVFYRRRRI